MSNNVVAVLGAPGCTWVLQLGDLSLELSVEALRAAERVLLQLEVPRAL